MVNKKIKTKRYPNTKFLSIFQKVRTIKFINLLRLRLASVIKLESRLFLGLTICLTESLVSCFIMNSNFYACPALSLELENTPGTEEVVGRNLTDQELFFKLETFLSKKKC